MRRASENAVTAVVILVTAVTGWQILRQNQEFRRLLAGQPRVAREGARLLAPPGYAWRSHPATVVIALRSGCPYCKASMGLYGEIENLWIAQHWKIYPLVLFSDPARQVDGRIRLMQRLANMDYPALGIASTPTVLLVDSSGRVLRKWAGQLRSPDDEQMLDAIRGLSAQLR